MSISNNRREGKKMSFAGSWGPSVFIISSILLTGSGFVFVGSTTAPMTIAFAQEGNNTTADSTPSGTTTTTTTTSAIPINQTHISATFSGNGTWTLPNTTDTINFTTEGTAIIALETHSVQAEETLTTEQGETATATFYEIAKFDPATAGEGKGLTMALIETDSTGMLAPLNSTILAGISDMQPNGETSVILWEWESGVGNNGVVPAAPTQ